MKESLLSETVLMRRILFKWKLDLLKEFFLNRSRVDENKASLTETRSLKNSC